MQLYVTLNRVYGEGSRTRGSRPTRGSFPLLCISVVHVRRNVYKMLIKPILLKRLQGKMSHASISLSSQRRQT